MSRWDPWRGCHRCSEVCRFCYIHKGDARRGIDTNVITRSEKFNRPIEKKKNGEYKMPPGLVYVCFSSDFLIEEADVWRADAWKIMKERSDCTFLFLTKRIERFMNCIPDDWGEGYDNVVVCCTVENQKNADLKLSVFQKLPIKRKQITAQPLIERIDIEKYLDGIESVVVGGESDWDARPLYYDWVLSVREQCVRKNVGFVFRQCGTHFVKDGKMFKLQVKDLCSQARNANIDYLPSLQI
jgi:protein gp37